MKKLFLSLLLPFLLITGCTSYTELNDLGLVSLLGIDYKDNKYQIYVTIMEGSQDDGMLEKNQKYFYSEANSLEEAFQKITLQSDKKIYLSHIDCLLVTEDLINNKLKNVLMNFLSNNESRNNFNIVLIKDNLETYFDEDITADKINKLILINSNESGTISEMDFELFLKNLLIDSNSTIPTISYNDNNLHVEGFTLIKDYMVYDSLSIEESFIFNLLNNKVEHAIFKNSTIYDSETIVNTNKNKVEFNISITTDKPNNINNDIKTLAKSLFNYYKDKNYDLFKLKNKIKQNDYLYYKNNRNLLESIEFSIKINTRLKNNYIEED